MNNGQGTMGSALGNGRRALADEVPAGYKRTEVGVIPEDWNAVLLGDLFVFKNGLNKAKQFFGSGTPIVNYMDVFEHPGIRMNDLSGRVNLSPEEIKNFEVRLGDVFFTRTSETVEEIGVASVMLDEPCDTVFSGFVLRARPHNDRLDDHYKQYCFGPRAVRAQIISNATYTTRALTNGRSLSAVWIAVPPKPEQRAIAEALSDVDELLAALEALIAKKRAVKQAAMQQLLTGESRLPGFSGVWETKRIGALFEAKAGGDVDPTRSSDVQSDSHPYPIYANSLSQEGLYGFCNYAENCPGSITVTARGTLGKAFYRDTPFVAIGRLLVLEPKVRMDARFFSSYINHSIHFAVESTGVPQLTVPQVARYSLPVPLEHEQRAISETLSDMDAEIAALERRRDKTRVVKQGMMQQLLTGRVRLVQLESGGKNKGVPGHVPCLTPKRKA